METPGMGHGKAWLGKTSVWCAILGIILPPCIVLLDYWCELDLTSAFLLLFAACVLFWVLELAAVICGIAARHTSTGRAGLAVVGTLAVLAVLFELYAWIRFR